MPITRAARGFTSKLSEEKTSPAVLPPNKRNAELRNVNEQMNRYIKPVNKVNFATPIVTRFTFPRVDNSENHKKTRHFKNTNSCTKFCNKFHYHVGECKLKIRIFLDTCPWNCCMGKLRQLPWVGVFRFFIDSITFIALGRTHRR